ncbi:MAG: aminotransferase class IV [Bacteroidota bacterium]
MNQYICDNGNFRKKEDYNISLNNRAFRYGDGFFETIRGFSTQPLLFEYHFQRIQKSLKTLKLKTGDDFNEELLQKMIEKLLTKNKLFKGARIRITFFRNGEGLYTPETNESAFIIESQALNDTYELNKKGLLIDVFPDIKINVSPLSFLKSINALPYVLAGVYKQEHRLDECILLNEHGSLCETISSNLFVFYNDTLYTPSLRDGCVAGVMRQKILEFAANNGITTEDTKPLTVNHLLDAEEIFITNAIMGIQWVGAFRNKRYFHFMASKLIRELNEWVFLPWRKN